MAGFTGRTILFRWGGNSPADEIAGVREKSIEINGESINVTSDEDDGWQTLLEDAAENSVNISISGVIKNATRIMNDWFSGTRIQPAALEFPAPLSKTLSGNFRLASLTITGTYNDATTFEASLESTGIVSYA